MKVILRKDVKNLGEVGDVVNVKDGYARNYLLPREIAYLAKEGSVRRIEAEKKRNIKAAEKMKETAEQLALKLADVQVSIHMKVGEEGRLYGSVTNQMISAELMSKGFDIDKKYILMDDAIRTLGIFDVKIKLHPDVSTAIKVWVIDEKEQ